ncbi:glycoside hydrolase family 2 TIM barrel-domain containing protein [Neolewinella lacunae]|uniref:Beta-glucuronidase n=1 Tax=Neolewinella lacunae TaxID=1517758 RepID=A0A923PM68_9BACT|nr:sugar-binding domain-containing protein [Neolewinella lacunae]MBC6994246.1 beta-glucuronidase [Neolewinella lacunae]MDN3637136.1 glycoside hydrolase family 2 TIM barrel-domain containing protein [Neolewinella lacunae]
MHYLPLLFCLLLCTCVRAQTGTPAMPRPEHPKPQFERAKWLNLNGAWDFRIDYSNTGEERNFVGDAAAYDRRITVPFPPESRLSGVEHLDFMDAVWYRRQFSVPAGWRQDRVILHFGAVDYLAKVWVNGQHIGNHYGGSASFELDVTDQLRDGVNDLVVKAEDDVRSRVQPAGKQSLNFGNTGCCKYTRTTGIWQTVWLEARPASYLESARVVPDLDNERFTVRPVFRQLPAGFRFQTTVFDAAGREVLRQTDQANSHLVQQLPLVQPRTWSPADPYLYDLRFALLDPSGRVVDEVKSYAGMRKIHQVGNRIFLNNEPIFLRFVLDQGYYPDGVWTAPSDAALKKDIELALSVGFNGARLHEKVFEERFHYWADKLGYLTWAEFPDWGIDRSYNAPEALLNVQREWRETIQRDWNHPSIIAWTPLNEVHSPKQGLENYDRAVREIYDLTRALDPTRPINTTSGFLHIKTDIWTVHDYSQNAKTFRENYAQLPDSAYYVNWDWYNQGDTLAGYQTKYDGTLPYVMDEYGGTFWLPEYASSAIRGGGRAKWGYGKTASAVEDKIAELTKVLTDHPLIAGFTYTQLTDVHQEVNGIFTFDRKPKFNPQRLRAIFGAPAAYEGPR